MQIKSGNEKRRWSGHTPESLDTKHENYQDTSSTYSPFPRGLISDDAWTTHGRTHPSRRKHARVRAGAAGVRRYYGPTIPTQNKTKNKHFGRARRGGLEAQTDYILYIQQEAQQ